MRMFHSPLEFVTFFFQLRTIFIEDHRLALGIKFKTITMYEL